MSSKDEGEAQKKSALESLTHDELVTKCKNLLSIAQRAKKARDDALEENNNYKHEIETLKSKIEEVGTLNGTLKQNLWDVRQELLVLKVNYDTLEKENKSGTEQLKVVENKLKKESAIREKLESDKINLDDDLEKLTENTEQTRIICNQIAEERDSLERQLEEVKTELYNINKEKLDWITYLSSEFPEEELSTVKSWVNFFSKYIQRFNEVSFKKFEENLQKNTQDNLFYNNEIEKLNLLIKEINDEKDLLTNEIVELKFQNNRTLENLQESNLMRDVMQAKLEEVRIETQNLIENSEKLSEENSMLKSDKNKLEEEVNNLSIEIIKINEENEKIKTDNKQMFFKNEDLNSKLEISRNDNDKINVEYEILKAEKNNLIKELNDIKESYSKLVEEHVQLQRECSEVHSTNVKLIENNDELKNLHSDDESKIKSNIDEINSYKEIIEKLKQENEILVNNVNKFESNLKEISRQNNTNSEDEKNDISLELIQIKKDLVNLIESIISQSNQYDDNNGIVEHVEDENNDILMVIKSLKTCINRLMDEKNSYKNSIKEFKININCINSKLLEYEKIIENLKVEKQQIKDLLEEKVFENNNMIRSLESLKLELEHISDHMKTSDKDKNDDVLENEKLSNNLKLVINERDQLSDKLKDLTKVNEDLLAIKENVVEDNKRSVKNNIDLKNRIAEIEEQHSKELKIINSEKDEINHRFQEVMKEKNDLLQQKEKLLTEKEHLSENIVEINKKCTDVEENLNKYIENNKKLSNQCVELQESRNILLRTIQSIINSHLTLVFQESKNLDGWENDEEFYDKLRHAFELIINIITEKTAEIKKLREFVDEKENTVRVINEERLTILNELDLFRNNLGAIDELFLKKDVTAKEIENSLKKIIDNSVIFSELCDSYSSYFNVDNVEAVKCVKEKLNQLKSNKWIINNPECENMSVKLEQDQSWEVVQNNKDRLTMEKSQELLSCETKSTDDDTIQKKDKEISELQEKIKELKTVAIKLKKKVTDLTKQLENEHQKYEADKNKWMHLSAAAKNAQSLQQECDRITDELEGTKKKMKALRKSCDVLEESETKLRQRVSELEVELEAKDKDVVSTKSQLENSLTSLRNVQKELEEMQKEKVAQDVIVKEFERELSSVQEKLKTTKLSLEQAKQETRKQSVLSLEMQDYERSVKELTVQVSQEKDHVKQLEEELDAKIAIQNSLHEQIELLEKRVASEEDRANVFSVQLNQTTENLKKAENLSTERSKQVSDLTIQLEKEKSNKDLLAIQLSDLTAENQKQIESTRLQNEALLNRAAKLETDLRCSEMKRVHVEEEMTRINKEFEAYKIRAQSVLRQRGGSAAEREAKEECMHIQELHNRTKSKLDLTMSELERVKSELSLVTTEKETLEKKCDNLNCIIIQRNKELDRQINEHRSHKISTDTLIQCYKLQLEEKERGYQMELDSLRDQLSKSINKYEIEKSKGVDMVTSMKDSSVNEMEISRTETNDNMNTLLSRPPLIEREDGEGSEGNESSAYSLDHSRTGGLVPLEKLLSSPHLCEDDRDVFSSEKFENLRTEIAASNTRVRHLTALLSESEKDSARKEEQIAVLKEEIRRLQRCIERQPHAHNTEYLKNVVFKFVTLNSGDERSRLVSVLDTILKLSPEEHRQLTAVAKGETEQSSTWGLYLPSWPSLQS